MSSRSRKGFTLVELLVVIAIIGILIALLLPAVQAAREAARRSQCLNNVKQMGLGLHNYHDIQRSFPPGNYLDANNRDRHRTTWAISILPFLEQQPLYAQYNMNVLSSDAVNKLVRETHIPAYNCPSDTNAGKIESPNGAQNSAQYAHTSYVGISGANDGVNNWWHDEPGTQDGGEWVGILHAMSDSGRACATMAGITDGTSNTMMTAERFTGPRNNTGRGPFFALAYPGSAVSTIAAQSRAVLPDYNRCVAMGGALAHVPCTRAVSSAHPGGFQVGLADGSTRFMSDNTDIWILVGMATKSRGETFQMP